MKRRRFFDSRPNLLFIQEVLGGVSINTVAVVCVYCRKLLMNEFVLLLLVLFIVLTLYLILLERKILSAYQRRMGPALMGRNGSGQILCDLFKMLSKEVFLLPQINNTILPVILSLLLTTQILFSINFVWGPNLYLVANLDAMILYHLILILLSNILFSMVGILSQSRYAIIGTIRGLVHVISLDIFITLLYSTLVLASQSSNFHDFVLAQSLYWYGFLYAPAAASFLLVLFLESKRAPFDHAETESEVVAGYSTELNGPMILLIFLCEYTHVIIAALHAVLFFTAGWLFPTLWILLPACWVPLHDNYLYSL